MYVQGFRFYFTPLTGVLFAFPSQYWFTIGQSGVFSLGGWSPHIQTGYHVSRPTHRAHSMCITYTVSHRIRPLSCLHSAVFLINSCSQLVSSTDFSSTSKSLHLHISVPSPEVTAPFCLVPSPEFSQAPEYSLPDHLCRFGVRFDVT